VEDRHEGFEYQEHASREDRRQEVQEMEQASQVHYV